MNVFDVDKLLHVNIGSLKGAVHRIVGEVEKEGLVVVAIDEVDGFTGQGIGQVFRLHHGLAAAHDGVVGIVVRLVIAHVGGVDQSLVADPAAFATIRKALAAQHCRHSFVGRRDEIMALVQESEELIETVPMGVIVRRAALVPFADQSGCVAGVLQGLGNRDFLHR